MQIALVAFVLLAGMWFTVLKPKPEEASVATPAAAAPAAPAASAPVAPGVKGLTSAVDKAKAASATSDAANARTESAAAQASGETAAAGSTGSTATKKAAVAKTTAATKKTGAAKPAAAVDPSNRILAYLAKGKTLVILFYGKGADDAAARKAVHRTALKDQRVVSAYIPIEKVGAYEAITSGVNVLTSPTVLVIGKGRKATSLTGFLEAGTIKQAVGDARRASASAAK
jgi:hypothetical protein